MLNLQILLDKIVALILMALLLAAKVMAMLVRIKAVVRENIVLVCFRNRFLRSAIERNVFLFPSAERAQGWRTPPIFMRFGHSIRYGRTDSTTVSP